ncbi:MAG: hypothetical protein O3A00_24610 [Planctomycetota bacterium]|nr:hypothetical protein [Planctomycetota bacterium]
MAEVVLAVAQVDDLDSPAAKVDDLAPKADNLVVLVADPDSPAAKADDLDKVADRAAKADDRDSPGNQVAMVNDQLDQVLTTRWSR